MKIYAIQNTERTNVSDYAKGGSRIVNNEQTNEQVLLPKRFYPDKNNKRAVIVVTIVVYCISSNSDT